MSRANDIQHPIDWADFQRDEMRVGTVLAASENPHANKPAYVLEIDFGPFGVKTSSAQLTQRYSAESLLGRQVVAVMNFPAKRIAGVKSEVLVLAALDEDGTTLLTLTESVQNGSRIA